MDEFATFPNDGDDEPYNICEGPLGIRHPIPMNWQPAGWAIKQLEFSRIPFKKQQKYLPSFVDFYSKKTHIMRFKTQWNRAFIAHCERNHAWEKSP